jgi:hypothetical protein
MPARLFDSLNQLFFAVSRRFFIRSCATMTSRYCRETMSRKDEVRPFSNASLYSFTAESSPRSHSARIAWSSPLVRADFRLIHARCIAAAALLVFSGFTSPKALAWVCSTVAKRERCCEYSLKSDLSYGSFTASAACLKPSWPSLSVSIKPLIVEITSFCCAI